MNVRYSERFLRSFEDAPFPIQKASINRYNFCYKIFSIPRFAQRNTTKLMISGKRASRATGVSISASKAILTDCTTSPRIRNRFVTYQFSDRGSLYPIRNENIRFALL